MVFPTQLLISYVEGLDLAIWNGGTLAVNGQDAAAVAGSSAVGFPEGLSPQFKDDIQDSTLFAQLASNAKYNPTTQSNEWYQYYRNVLENLGWGVQNFDMTEMKNANAYLSVDNLLLKIAGTYLTAPEIGIFKAMLDSLASESSEKPRKIFNESSMSSNKANFQIGMAGEANGNAILKISGYNYGIQGKIVDVLFTNFGTQSAQFFYSSQTMALNDDVYGTVRELVQSKLSTNAKTMIASISLGVLLV